MKTSCSGCKHHNKPQYGYRCGEFVGMYYGCDLGCYAGKECRKNKYSKKE